MIKYIFKNIFSTLKESFLISVLYVLCLLVSIIVILFSHGVYQNYETKLLNNDTGESLHQDQAFFSVGKVSEVYEFEGTTSYFSDETFLLSDFRKFLDILDDETKASFTGFLIEYDFDDTYDFVDEEWTTMDSRIEYDESAKQYGLYSTYMSNISASKGRLITQEEELNGDMVITLPYGSDEKLIGQKIEFIGQEYEVIGIQMMNSYYTVPFNTIPDSMPVKNFSFLIDKPITTETYKKIANALTEVFVDEINLPKFETVDESEQTFYVSVMAISVVLSMLSAINLTLLFRYILSKRRKTFAIYRMVGLSKFRTRLMCLIEILGINTLGFLLCSLLFHFVLIDNISKVFERFGEVYSTSTYLYLFAVFIGVIFIFMEVVLRKQVSSFPFAMLKKGGGK